VSPPGKPRGRPAGDDLSEHATTTTAVTDTVPRRTDRWWRKLRDCPPGSLKWVALAYRCGVEDGTEQGYARAEADMAAAWHAVWVKTRAVLAQPTRAELARRRGES
jgi:hypothetical protein